MLNALLGGVTLLAIFLHAMNIGRPFGAVCAVVSSIGLVLGHRNVRARLRETPPPHTKITG